MTTGSTVQGLVQGLVGNIGCSGTGIGEIIKVLGDPNGVVVQASTSGIAWDGKNNQAYMMLGAGTWVKLGSVA